MKKDTAKKEEKLKDEELELKQREAIKDVGILLEMPEVSEEPLPEPKNAIEEALQIIEAPRPKFHLGCTVCGKKTGELTVPLDVDPEVDLASLTKEDLGIADIRCDDHPVEPEAVEVETIVKTEDGPDLHDQEIPPVPAQP